MDALRWILLIVGLLVIAGLYAYFRWKEGRLTLRMPSWKKAGSGRKPSRSRRSERDVDVALRELDDLVIDDPDSSVEPDPDLAISPDDGPFPVDWDDPDNTVSAPRVRPVAGQRAREESASAPKAAAGGQSPEQDPAWQDAGEKLIVLYVTAGQGYVFTGPPLMDALERVGLQHGMHDVFHHMIDAHSGPTPLFSAANMLEPGTFDLRTVDQLETPGVVLFLQLPGPFDGLTAFEKMLETARRLEDQLGGQLLDRQRCDLTGQAVEHLREELREYRRRARLAGSQRR
ncbi:cell division protein ZipA [Methylonatrum kenyense]|uniref:cell division protein ZipA n=1 Tax=Methylonatrum kenyense TaxID=455253 RepID=UPI0020BE8BF0|nr:cell division protein ZipA [Methylonatrum kenyense]MCK8515946.1 cell division protein ZipA [Methylonatrum kenyense]